MTARHKKKEETQDSGEQYRLLFESNPHPMWVYDHETLCFLAVNDAAVRHYGYSRDEFLGMTIKDISQPGDIPAFHESVPEVTAWLDAAGVWRHKKKDGSIIDVEITSRALTFEGRHVEVVLANDITERRRAEQALLKSEGKLREAQRIAHLGSWDVDFQTNRAYWSDEIYNILGLTPGKVNLDYETFMNYVHPDDQEFVKKSIYEAREGRKPFNIEHRIIRQDGGERTIHSQAELEFDTAGKPLRMSGAVLDITERRKVEDAFRQSKEFNETVLNSINDAISIIDVHNFRIIDANQAFLNTYGLKKEDIKGKRCYEIVHRNIEPCTPPDNLCPLQNSLKSGKPSVIEHINHIKEGSPRYIEVSTSPIRNKEGEIVHVVHVARDVTGRRRAETELRRQREEYRVIFDSMPAIIWYIDREGRIMRANKTAAEAVGLPVDKVIGRSTYDLYPEDAAKFRADDIEVINSGKPKLGIIEEYKLLTGKRGWARTDKVPYRDKDGNIIGVIILAQDITEQKRTEEKLKHSQKMLQKILDSMPYGIIIVNRNKKILRANNAALAMAGYESEKQVKGTICNKTLCPAEEGKCPILDLKGTIDRSERILLTADRRSVPILKSVVTVELDGEEVLLEAFIDITEHKEAEKLLKEKARAELYGFIVSALPVFASSVPSPVRDNLVRNFAKRFESNFRPGFEEGVMRSSGHDAKRNGVVNMQNMLDAYMLWLSGLFSNFGIQTAATSRDSRRDFELLNCPWKGEASGNPIFCFICRTIVMRSFTWTFLDGEASQKSSIANGSKTCVFEIHFKSMQ